MKEHATKKEMEEIKDAIALSGVQLENIRLKTNISNINIYINTCYNITLLKLVEITQKYNQLIYVTTDVTCKENEIKIHIH